MTKLGARRRAVPCPVQVGRGRGAPQPRAGWFPHLSRPSRHSLYRLSVIVPAGAGTEKCDCEAKPGNVAVE